MVVKKQKKRKVGRPRKKRKVGRPRKVRHRYISDDSFEFDELQRYVSVLRKMRRGKRTRRQRRIGLTNTISFLNLLYNADKERRRRPYLRRNIMRYNRYRYPSLISDADLPSVWNATKLPTSKTRTGLVNNINNAYRHLLAYDLIHAPRGSNPQPLPEMQTGKEKQPQGLDDDVREFINISDDDSDAKSIKVEPESSDEEDDE